MRMPQLCRLGVCACAVTLLCASLHAQQKTEGPYRISGTVVNAATGEPLNRAGVSIVLSSDFSPVQSIQTGADGRFAFDHLPAGKYALTGSRRGFITAAYDEHEQYSTAIVTGEGLISENLVLRLEPGAVISGIVAEDSGDPVENARVTLYRQAHDSGVEKVRQAGSTTTDDIGAYEFTELAPGDYFISVSGRPWYADTGGGMIRSSATPNASGDIPHSPLDLVYATTFYADTTNPEDATPVPLKGGDRVQINFSLHAQPALHLLIRSPVSDDPRQMNMMPGAALEQEVFGTSDYVETNSHFIAPGLTEISVAPGEYRLRLSGPGSQSTRMTTMNVSSDQSIDAGGGQQLADVTGKIAMASGEALPPNTAVILSASDGQGGNGSIVSKDGNFGLANVQPGKYRLEVVGRGKRFFVAKLAATGAQIENGRVTIGSSPVMIAATVYPDPDLEVTGYAKKEGKPVPGAMIVLVPRDPANNRDLFRRDQSDSDGSFSLRDVIPGKYTVVAVENGWTLDWAEPSVIAHYLAGGEPVTVTEGAKTTTIQKPVEAQPK
jgi:hypothetical protein